MHSHDPNNRKTQSQARVSCWRLLLAAGLLLHLCGCQWMSHGQNSEGVRMYQQGQYQAAIQRFQKAMATDPKNPDAYYNLAAAYHKIGTVNQRQEELVQAENYYNQCLDHDPNHRDCHRALAVLLVEEGRTDEAFRLLEGWASRSPALAAPRVELARLSEELGKTSEAKEYLLEALTSDPYDARALAALGRLNESTGNHAQALANYQRSLWHDRFQPEVAARVSSLRSALSPAPLVTSPNGTRTVNTNSAAPR